MPEVRCVKVFESIPAFRDPDELLDFTGVELIEADSFPHSIKIGIIALVRVEPNFYGTFTLRFPEDTPDYHEMGISNTKNEFVRVVVKYDAAPATFPKAGTYYASLALDGEIIHKTPVKVVKEA